MNLLVTGGCGFIGGHFVRHCLDEGGRTCRELVNLDKLTYAANPSLLKEWAGDPRYRFVRGDIGDTALVNDLLARHDIGAVCHFAAETHVDRSINAPRVFLQTNALGTQSMLEASLRHWRDLPASRQAAFRFLHVSTDEVYGSLLPGHPPCAERSRFAPNSPYAAAKAAGDHLVRAYNRTYGLPTLTARPSNAYGPGQFPEKLIPRMLHCALGGLDLPVYGDGQQERDWVFVTDLAAGLWQLLLHGRPGGAYNFGADRPLSNLAVVREICRFLDARAPRSGSYAAQIKLVADRPGHDRRYALDSSKARRELGWNPAREFASGLAETVAWCLVQPARPDATVGDPPAPIHPGAPPISPCNEKA